MGSASSKAAKTAAGAASRQYPTRVPNNLPPSASPQTSSTYTSPIISTSTQSAQTSQPPAANSASTDIPPASPTEAASTSRTAAIDNDASDPHFAASLRRLGPVTPSSTRSNSSTFSSTTAPLPHHSPPSTTHQPPQQQRQLGPADTPIFPSPSPQNPALLIFQARERLAAEEEREIATSQASSGPGPQRLRRFLDVNTIRQALVLRDSEGLSGAEIEAQLGLREGVMGLLGRVGEARVGKADAGDTGLD